MGVIAGVLKEEWERLNEAEALFQEKVAALPSGSMVIKSRDNRKYLYISERIEGVQKFKCLGNLENPKVNELKKQYLIKRNYQKRLIEIHKDMKEFKSYIKLNKLKEIVG